MAATMALGGLGFGVAAQAVTIDTTLDGRSDLFNEDGVTSYDEGDGFGNPAAPDTLVDNDSETRFTGPNNEEDATIAGVTNFTAVSIDAVRIYLQEDDRRPTQVTIGYANTVEANWASSTVIDTFDIPLANEEGSVDMGDDAYQVTFNFDATPTDTQSLLFNFGTGGQRIREIEAFAVPEPASVALLGLGGLLIGARRGRRHG
ncbi:MAG: PEP-CTERM sorting domain-containing protein [Phycisphaeraceae bacterium]